MEMQERPSALPAEHQQDTQNPAGDSRLFEKSPSGELTDYTSLEAQGEGDTLTPPHDVELDESSTPWYVLPAIVYAQVAGGSVWFGGNAVGGQMGDTFGWPDGSVGYLGSGVQLGFIMGTFISGITGLPDVIAGRWIFASACIIASVANASIVVAADSLGLTFVVFLRVITGVCMAGVYPIGMAIAATWYPHGLGVAVGWLVGALVIGTALPHMLLAFGEREGASALSWEAVLLLLSAIALSGGATLALLVPPGPAWKPGAQLSLQGVRSIFASPAYLRALGGYCGHMWELYAFWMCLPMLLSTMRATGGWGDATRAGIAFVCMSVGGVGCVAGGYASQRYGSAEVAAVCLALSGSCCLCSPLLAVLPAVPAVTLLVVWGLTVVPDSPQLSALIAKGAPREYVGTAFTCATCMGFSLTVVSIQIAAYLIPRWGTAAMLICSPGPALGIWSLSSLLSEGGLTLRLPCWGLRRRTAAAEAEVGGNLARQGGDTGRL